MRIPTFHSTAKVYTGASDTPPNTLLIPNLSCEVYETSITKRGGEIAPAALAYWTLLTPQVGRPKDGYDGYRDIWYPGLAYSVRNVSGLDADLVFSVRGWGVRWIGQAGFHYRWYLVPSPTWPSSAGPQKLPPDLGGVSVYFDTFRPFGAGTPFYTNQPGMLYADMIGGRGGYSGGNYTLWTHFLDFSSSLDIRDGTSRASGLDTLSYADGDGVSIPAGGASTKYVVVRVISYADAANVVTKRAYLLRDQPKWPGP